MTTTPADEIAAVETAFSVAEFDSNAYNWYYDEKDPDRKFISPEIVAGRTAFAAIVSRLRALEAERARLREAVVLCNDALTDVVGSHGKSFFVRVSNRVIVAQTAAGLALNPPTDNG